MLLMVTMATAFISAPISASAQAHPAGGAKIVRDEYGVPHVFAATVRDLFFGNGYATGQDRLFQADLVRRTATGTLSELLGAGTDGQNVAGDEFFRSYTGGTAALRSAFEAMPASDRTAVTAYVAGLNAWIALATRAGDLPPEYAGMGRLPQSWSETDVLASAMLDVLQVGAQGFDELHNAAVLRDLTGRLGVARASAVFADTHWLDDPSSVTTVPSPRRSTMAVLTQVTGAGRPATAFVPAQVTPVDVSPAASARVQNLRDAATVAMDRLGLAGVGHSNAIAISGQLSKSGFPLLLGGPQIGHSVPQGFMELGLHGAGYEVTGVVLAGTPGIQIGIANGQAWTVTSGGDDNQDAYLDILDPAVHPGHYFFDGGWRALDCRLETIDIAGAAATSISLCQDVHGPVLDMTGGTAIVIRDATRARAGNTLHGFLALDRMGSLDDFVKAARSLGGSFNLTYAGHTGHIAYAHVGPVPQRPIADNRFLPHPGNGSDEWQGLVPSDRMPLVIDPTEGWLANWNNKPAQGWTNSSDGFWQWGPVHRGQVLVDQLRGIRPHTATIATLERINRITGQTTETPVADESNVIVQRLLPALLDHLQIGADPRLAAVAKLLTRWNHQRIDANADGGYDSPAVALFNAWYSSFSTQYLTPVLGTDYRAGGTDENVTSNLALRLLQGRKASLVLKGDYLQHTPLAAAVTGSLITALDQLTAAFHTPDAAQWLTPIREILWAPMGIGGVPNTPFMNRGTYNQIISLGPCIHGENVVAPGQSGDPRSPHFADQLQLYATWHYKPMHLTAVDIGHHTTTNITVPFTRP
ncbi:penicillin amidase [Nakamurella sp. UYEF19]|uniref:penicillin acylase family protein n=1 Tax=Nakamurella sp. UYEF19 TaxID=1756392 RepID=UPI003393B8FF